MPSAFLAPDRLHLQGAGGVPLVADRYGPEAGPTALLLHGGGQTRHAWGGTAAALAEAGWRVVALDQRGHGDSGWPEGPDYDTDHFAADVRSVCGQLGGRPVAVGASLGGMAALTAQHGWPRPLFSGLVLVDITPRMEPAGVRRVVEFMLAHPDGFATVEEAADAIATYRPTGPRRRSTGGLGKVLRRGDDGRWRWHWDPRFMLLQHPEGEVDEAAAARVAEEMRARLTGAAREVRVSTLLVRGALSDPVTPEAARELLEFVAHARYVDVSDAGHMVAGDRNDAFTAEVLRFVTSLPGTRDEGAVARSAGAGRFGQPVGSGRDRPRRR